MPSRSVNVRFKHHHGCCTPYHGEPPSYSKKGSCTPYNCSSHCSHCNVTYTLLITWSHHALPVGKKLKSPRVRRTPFFLLLYLSVLSSSRDRSRLQGIAMSLCTPHMHLHVHASVCLSAVLSVRLSVLHTRAQAHRHCLLRK